MLRGSSEQTSQQGSKLTAGQNYGSCNDSSRLRQQLVDSPTPVLSRIVHLLQCVPFLLDVLGEGSQSLHHRTGLLSQGLNHCLEVLDGLHNTLDLLVEVEKTYENGGHEHRDSARSRVQGNLQGHWQL